MYRIVSDRRFPLDGRSTSRHGFAPRAAVGTCPGDHWVRDHGRRRGKSDAETTCRGLEAGGHLRLAPAEELALARCYRMANAVRQSATPALAGQDDAARAEAGRRARDRLVLANIGLVLARVDRQAARALMSRDDLVQEGLLGLLRAVKGFDPDQGHPFSSYAYWAVRNSVDRAIVYRARLIHLPPKICKRLRRLKKEQQRLWLRLGRCPADEELAAELRWAIEEVRALSAVPQGVRSLSVLIGKPERNRTREPKVSSDQSPERLAERKEMMPLVRRALGALSQRSRKILIYRFGLFGRKPRTLQWVGRKLGLTRERVRQLQKKALEKLALSQTGRLLRLYAADL